MKKKSLILITAVTLLVALLLPVFASCGETNEPPKDPTYKITATSTADYAITASATSAKAGDNIEVTVSVLNDDKYLTKVLYNGKNCYFSNGKYSFDMPSEDVTITAELATYTEVLKDGIASFDLGNITSLKKTEYEDFAELEVDLNTSYMTNCITEFTSSNQKVIPDNAISFRARYQSQSNIIIGGYVQIDTSKISNGTTWLTMKFKNGNVSGASNSGELVVKITVAEEMLQTNDEIDLFLALNDPMAEGAYIAAKNAGREGDILFVGFDGLPTPDGGIRSVMDGRLSMTQVYPTGGAEAIESAYQLLVEGKELEKTLTLTSEIVIPDNAEELLAKYGGSAE